MPAVLALEMEAFNAYATELIGSGRYTNANEVMQAALDALRREQASDEAKREWLIQAIKDGEASGVYQGNPFAAIRAKYGFPARASK